MTTKKHAAIPVLLIVALLFSIIQAAPVKAQIDYESYNGLSVSATPVLPNQEVHPKLWFDDSQINDMYAKRNADDYAASLWNAISTSKYLTISLPQSPGCVMSNAVHSYYGDMARIAKYNAFMFVMEGNHTYKERATEALKRAYDGPVYDCEAITPTVSGSPIDETYRANWAQNFAAAYDWLQPHLSAEDDALIRDRLAYEAQILYENIWIRPNQGWGPRPHNHRSKPAWGLGSLALTLSDYSHPEMASPSEWLQEALEAANSNLEYFFSADGVYREGSQYYIYSHINFVPFLYHYKNVSGVDHFRDYKPAFIWEFQVSGNNGWMPNFADSFLRHNFMHMVAGQFMSEEDETPLHPTAKWGNLFQWRYATTDTSPWGGEFGNNTGASYDDTMDLDKYLTYEPAIEAIAPVGTGTSFFLEGGQTIFRNNWLVGDPSSRYLLFQGVAEADNHNHFDHLSFIIHAENQMMASDAGYSQSAYGDPIRRTWYRTAPAHNTVTLDGYWPVDMEQNATPESRHSIDTDFFDFQQKSARYIEIPLTSSNENPLLFPPDSESLGYITRAIAFPDQQYFVVADQLSVQGGAEAADFSLYLHGGKGAMTGEGNFRQWTYGNDMYGSPAKLAAWILMDEAEFIDREGEVTYVKDDYTTNGYVEAKFQAQQANALQILLPLGITERLPKVVNMSDSARAGGTVSLDGNLDTYMVQQGDGEIQLGDVTTDATFAYVSDNGLPRQYSVREASALEYQGEQLFSSSAKITAAIDISDRERHTGVLSTDETGYSISLPVPFGKQTVSAQFGGATALFVDNNGMVTVTGLDGSGELVVEYEDAGVPDTIAPASINDLAAANATGESIELLWTAPGNDGQNGTAAYYDIRYSTDPITELNWQDASQATGEPKPRLAGSAESFVVDGLYSSTTYYFAIKTGDQTMNLSGLSNIAEAETEYMDDVTPPAGILDLRASETTTDSATLHWQSTGNDGFVGTAASYDLRYSPQPITEDNWALATKASGLPEPEVSGSDQSVTVGQLLPGRTYFFAIKSSDEAGNVSVLSNGVFVAMQDGDTAVKLDVASVSATNDDGNVPANTIDGDFATRWSSNSPGDLGSRTPQSITFDLGMIEQLSYMKIAYYSGNVRKSYFDLETSIDGVNWVKVANDKETSGMTLDFETYELGDSLARYVKLNGYGNISSGWNSIAEVEIYGSTVLLPEVTVGEVYVEDWQGNALTELVPGEAVSVHVPITNNRAENQKVTVVAGLYNERNRLVKAITIGSEIAAWETEVMTAGIKLPEQMDGHELRVLVWDDLIGMNAKADPVTIS